MFYISSHDYEYSYYQTKYVEVLLTSTDFYKIILVASLSYASQCNYKVHFNGGDKCINIKKYKNGLFGWRLIDNAQCWTTEFEDINNLFLKHGIIINDKISKTEDILEDQKDIKCIKTYRCLSGDIEITPSYLEQHFPENTPIIKRIMNNSTLGIIADDIITYINTPPIVTYSIKINYADHSVDLYNEKKHTKHFKFNDYGMNTPSNENVFLGALIGSIINKSKWEYDDFKLYIPGIKEEKKVYHNW